ncbi:MAG TPA: chromate efflux transporter [Burkholderiales bacterium]|jgi:chromate transporter|nr:chromate efflux transporter [Burkholderiales bacterium]
MSPGARGPGSGPVFEVFAAFLRLGLTSFGGPIAHLGYFRHEFVERRKWLDEAGYADLVALCQFLPGPASSQVGMSIGLLRAGLPGALAAWIAFTAPSAIALVLFAYGASALEGPVAAGVLHGLKIITVAVVAQAVWSMGRAICTDRARLTIAFVSAGILLAWPGAAIQVLVIAAAAIGGGLMLRTSAGPQAGGLEIRVPGGMAATAGVLFLALLVLLPLAALTLHSTAVAMFDTFYRAGALVFGGGHVVLPLLQSEVIPHGWVDNETFLAGYGAAQAVPGPLFTFAAYLGAASGVAPNGWAGALLCLSAIFLPSLLLVLAALPYWQKLRQQPSARAALAGVNASVVGLLLAALYQPVWTSAIGHALDFALALGAFLLLVAWRWSPLWVVLAAIAAGALQGAVA